MEITSPVKYIKACSSYHFKFNYTQIKDLKAEQFVSTPVFHALGYDWVIDCYPQGLCQEMNGLKTSFLVRLQGEYKNTNPTLIGYSLMITCRPKTALLGLIEYRRFFQVTKENSPFQGQVLAHFNLNKSSLLNGLANDGSFELICSIDNTDIPPNMCSLEAPKSFNLNSQIGNLLESSETADVIFDVENQSFRCHRTILAARSPVLKAGLFGNMVEATQKRIKIENICPEVFKAMIHFMYTDSLPCYDSETMSAEIMAQQLFVVADRYAIEGLKALCEDKLCHSISLDMVAASLALAERHNSPRLKNSCLEFIAEPGTLISWMLTEEYADLVRNFPSLIAEIRGKVATVPSFRELIMPEKQ